MKTLDKNIKQTVSVSAAGCLKWSRRLPRTTGFYWIRSHGGIGAVVWFIAPCLVARFYNGAEVLLTRDFRSMQQIEFYPGRIVPPN